MASVARRFLLLADPPFETSNSRIVEKETRGCASRAKVLPWNENSFLPRDDRMDGIGELLRRNAGRILEVVTW